MYKKCWGEKSPQHFFAQKKEHKSERCSTVKED